MSGGFFRGTSADQDTRFSNKQVKLLQSQKFAPELEHLVDMSKVNMEVMKPWITKRVTELLGFEDEKSPSKRGAQKNASGVPQQFLDAKEEELRKKKVENERITNEIQRKKDKEGREIRQERLKKTDGEFDAKDIDAASDPASKLRDSGDYIQDGKETYNRNGVRASSRFSRSPHSPAVSISPHRGSPSRSTSKSFSNSQSYSGSRSISRSKARGRSLSSERIRHSPQRRSISPPRRYSPWRSPSLRRRSLYSRRRSRSRSHYRSPSPIRRRMHSSFRRRSPLRRHRSPSPVRRRRSPSSVHWRQSRSPIQRQRPTPLVRHRSPVCRISPVLVRRRSRFPMQSPSLVRQRYRRRSPPSPLRHRSAVSGHSPNHSPQRDPSSDEWSSQSPVRHVSPSPVRRSSPRCQRNPVQSSRERIGTKERLSPEARQKSSSLRSVQRDKDHTSSHYKSQDSISTPKKSPQARNRTSSENKSPHESSRTQRGEKLTHERSLSPSKKPRIQKPIYDITERSEGEEETYYSRESRDPKSKSSQKKSNYPTPVRKQKDSPAKFHSEDEVSPEKAAGHLASESCAYYDNIDLSKKGREVKSDKSSGRGDHPETFTKQKSSIYKKSFSSARPDESYAVDSKKSEEKKNSHSNHAKDSYWCCKSEAAQDSIGKVDRVNQSASYDSGYEESGKHRREGKDRRKHKRSERKAVSSDEGYSSVSELEDRKEAKRRKKEDKCRRREPRRRRREERRAEKLKLKSKTDYYTSDDKEVERMDSDRSDKEETLSEQKKLEIELRNKALESLKAKRGINH